MLAGGQYRHYSYQQQYIELQKNQLNSLHEDGHLQSSSGSSHAEHCVLEVHLDAHNT